MSVISVRRRFIKVLDESEKVGNDQTLYNKYCNLKSFFIIMKLGCSYPENNVKDYVKLFRDILDNNNSQYYDIYQIDGVRSVDDKLKDPTFLKQLGELESYLEI
jgi:hypothetical protein